jgi:hypothetical protein
MSDNIEFNSINLTISPIQEHRRRVLTPKISPIQEHRRAFIRENFESREILDMSFDSEMWKEFFKIMDEKTTKK